MSPSTSTTSPAGGEIVVFLGPSGCGKSTILKAVAGLLPPTSGEILVDGVPVVDVGRDRGMVFQAYTSFGWLTVRDNVEYGLKLQGVSQGRATRTVGAVPEGRRSRGVRRPLSEGPVGRHEAARGHRADPHQPAARRPDGRAVRRARPADPLGDAGPAARRLARRKTTPPCSSRTTCRRRSTSPTPCTCSPARPARILHRVDVPFFADARCRPEVGRGVPRRREAAARPALRPAEPQHVELTA